MGVRTYSAGGRYQLMDLVGRRVQRRSAGVGGSVQARTRKSTVESAALLRPPGPPPAPAGGGGGGGSIGAVPWTRGGQLGRLAAA